MDWEALKEELAEYAGEEVDFSITIESDGEEKTMELTAEVGDDGEILFITSPSNCIYINFNDLPASKIKKTDECTDPPLEDRGNTAFLTNVKEQLIVGLGDNIKKIEIMDLATAAGGNYLSPFKLVRGKSMTYEPFGYSPAAWASSELDQFKEYLANATMSELSEELQDKIADKLNDIGEDDNFNDDDLIQDVMDKIDLADDDLSEDICVEILEILQENKGFDEDLTFGDPNNDLKSIYFQEKYIDGDETYDHVVVGYEVFEDNNGNYNGNRSESSNENGASQNNYRRNTNWSRSRRNRKTRRNRRKTRRNNKKFRKSRKSNRRSG